MFIRLESNYDFNGLYVLDIVIDKTGDFNFCIIKIASITCKSHHPFLMNVNKTMLYVVAISTKWFSTKITNFKPLPVWVADNQQQMYQRINSLPRR